MHGFLLLTSADGKILAEGDEMNVVKSNLVRSRLIFRFRDGSVDDETTVFTQGRAFRLVSDHHIQKGPSFPKPLDLTIDVPMCMVTWREFKDGKVGVRTQHVDMPDDLANGLIALIAENFPPHSAETKVSYLTIDSKPRIVSLSMKPDGQDSFRLGGITRRATRYTMHVELHGITGVVAPLIGKQPADTHVWVLEGELPTFLRVEGPFYEQGPIWEVELTSPVWPRGHESR